MLTPSVAYEDVLPKIAASSVGHDVDSHVEPIIDPATGRELGLLVESELERVVIARRDQPEVALEDVSRIRQILVRVRARRGLLCVPIDAVIPNPVMLLATLSRIEIVRLRGGPVGS